MTYASAVSTPWSIDLFVLHQYKEITKRTNLKVPTALANVVMLMLRSLFETRL